MTNCRWCPSPAIESHLIPRAIRAIQIQKQGPLGLRPLNNPNLVEQNPLHTPLLCTQHDGQFSTDEGSFIGEIYRPLLNGAVPPLSYGPWLRRFAIFLSWKVLTDNLDQAHSFDAKAVNQARSALLSWEKFLREGREKNLYSHHIIIPGWLKTHGLSAAALHFYENAFECMVFPTTEGGLMVWTTFPDVVVISAAYRSNDFRGWPTSKIQKSGQLTTGFDGNIVDSLEKWAKQSLSDISGAIPNLSAKQKRKIQS